MHQQKYGIRQRQHLMGILLGIVILWHWGTGESAACILTSISCNSPCTATADGCTCPADTDVSFTAHLSVACGIDDTIWRVTDLDSGQVNEYSYNLWQPGFTYTFSEAGAYTVKVIVYPTSNPASAKLITVTVSATSYTVNIVPSAGCTVTAGDGGVDTVEAPNGIVCSGGMAANDPLCTEQFENSQIASLKVVPESGYAFTGWTVNGAQIQTAAAPLFLTTMPVLAQQSGTIQLPVETPAEIQPECPKEVEILLSFDDGPHTESLSGGNYTIQVLNELVTNSVQVSTKAMWCIQTHVSYRGGHPNGQAVIQEQSGQGHVVAIHTGSDEDHVPHTNRVEILAYDADGDGDVDADDGMNALESDMICAKSRITDLTGNIPKYVRPVGAITIQMYSTFIKDKTLK